MTHDEGNEERSLLLDALVSGAANPADWQRWDELAAGDPGCWRLLAESQRDEAELRSLVQRAGDAAANIELAQPAEHAAGSAPRLPAWLGWSGWAVAACLTVAFVLAGNFFGSAPMTDRSITEGNATAYPVATTARDAFDRYLLLGQEEGFVVDELPERVLLSAQPASEGNGYELLYLRQVLERVSVPRLFEIEGQDEQGDAGLVRYEQPARLSI